MSEQKSNDGGRAFPCFHPSAPEVGMSLRTWLAGMALSQCANGCPPEAAASYAVACADATLKELEKD